MINDLIRGKKVLLAFSDPAGALEVLAFAEKYFHLFKSIIAVSDKQHNFYCDFSTNVEVYTIQKPLEWLASNQIDLVITGTSLPLSLEIAFIEAAAKNAVISISLVDHWINIAMRFKKLDFLVLPDWIGVIDDRAKRIAIEEGLPVDKIIITGNPYYEFLSAWNPTISREDFLNSVDIPANAGYVLYAPEPLSTFNLQKKFGFTEIDGIRKINQAMKPFLSNKFFILIKGHANQRHEVFHSYIDSTSNHYIKYNHKIDIKLCTHFSECVMGFFSNSLIEAKIMKKKVIRPLMLLIPNVIDPLESMSSENFKAFRDDKSFTRAVESMFHHSKFPSLPPC